MKKISLITGLASVFLCLLFMGLRDIGRYPEKIWLHRCNSLEKLYEKQSRYPNVEVDLVFRKDRVFDAVSYTHIKNLTAGNKYGALERMNEMTEYFQIAKDRLIIEGKDWKALEAFTQDGYYTSYYVTYDEPDDLSEEEVDDCIEELQEIADKEVVSALSFPGYWYTEIKEGLNRSIDLLTWKHRSSQLQFLLSSVGREMLADPQLKVVLVKEKGRFHR